MQKDIRKGLGQLKGAAGNVRAGTPLVAADGVPIEIPNRETSILHAIVLLSEMYHAVDWKAVANEAIELTDGHRSKAMFHVMDLSELKAMAARCPNGEHFSNRLLQRWCQIKERRTAYIRMITLPDEVLEAVGDREKGTPPFGAEL